ncbi:MAG: hypothetical protein R3B90_12090 [Planctomycetaceae bacterium]
MFATVVPRYLDPAGDHPPYTLVEFDVRLSPTPLYRSRPASIEVNIGGPEQVEQATVVWLPNGAKGDQPAQPRRLPMFRRDERSYVLEIAEASESARFYIDTPQGRSPTIKFDVLEVPFIEQVSLRYDYPAYTGWPSREQPLDTRGLGGWWGPRSRSRCEVIWNWPKGRCGCRPTLGRTVPARRSRRSSPRYRPIRGR